jgi:hypothetical protein
MNPSLEGSSNSWCRARDEACRISLESSEDDRTRMEIAACTKLTRTMWAREVAVLAVTTSLEARRMLDDDRID